MNNKKIFEKIITEKRAKSSNERPKYGLRKLTVGVVSCLLGYMMFFTPNVVAAEKVEQPQAVEATVESTEVNNVENAEAESEQPKEKPAEIAKTAETEKPVSHVKAYSSNAQDRIVGTTEEEKSETATEEKTEEAKQADSYVPELEAIKVVKGNSVEDYRNAFKNLPEDATIKVINEADTNEAGNKIATIEITFADQSKKQEIITVKVYETQEDLDKAVDDSLGLNSTDEKQSVKAASTTPVTNDTQIQDEGSIEQEIPFREKTSGVEKLDERDGGPIRYNTLEARNNENGIISLEANYWPQGGASGLWGTSEDPNAEYAGKYVISFDNPEFYKNIQTVTTVDGAGPLGEKSWTPLLGGRDWTMVMNNANTGAGIVNTNKRLKLEIALKGGKTLKDLGLDKTPLSFTAGIVGGTANPEKFNKILAHTIDNGFIMAENPNNPSPKENPDLFRNQGVPTVFGDNRYNDGGFTKDGMGQKVYYDKDSKSIISRHTFKPTQNFLQSNDDAVVYIKEQIPKVLVPFIDRENIYVGAMNDITRPDEYRTSVGA